jgi:PAS domain S-box-containing protein
LENSISQEEAHNIEQLRQFIDTSTIISKADANGKITYVNKKFTEVSGYTLEEIVGKNHNVLNSGEHPREFWSEMYKTVVKDRGIWNAVCTNRSKDGNLYYVDTYIKAEFDKQGKLIEFMSIRQDVTNIKKKEAEFRNRMTAINNSNAVIEFDTEGNIIYANNQFLSAMGYKMDEVQGKHHRIFVDLEYAESKEYEEFWEQLRKGNYMSGEVSRVKKDGSLIQLQSTYNPIFNTSGQVYRVMKIAVDVTDRLNQRREIEKKNSYLEHAAKILRHDMHSGINTYIPRGISSLERRLPEEKQKDLKVDAPIKMIKEGLRHTQKVYKGVYEFTNLVKKDVVLNKTMCNLSTILDDYLSATAYRPQVIISDLGESEVNEALFCTAIDNLIRNGLKYNDSLKKEVHIRREGDLLFVEDNGRGMTPAEFKYLSQPYTRKEGQNESGTGLGLNICVAIIEEHGFELNCQQVTTGTRMEIKLK